MHPPPDADASAVSRGEALLAWYADHRRDLPWRHTSDPYRILVSEVMLQQTQVRRVVPIYRDFLERFPDERRLASAALTDVLDAWHGLGYPVRARRLREAVRFVVQQGWPRTADGLAALPGVGPYTAAAVASFAFGERVAAVDTNVRRVVSRWHGEPLAGTMLTDAARDEITGDSASWNQALMELGALVCRPIPRCDECPVAGWCLDPSVYSAPPRRARYEGSLRQVRGDVLQALGASPVDLAGLSGVTGHPHHRVEAAVSGLAADGLVVVDEDRVALAG